MLSQHIVPTVGLEAARNSSSDEGAIIARPMQRMEDGGDSPKSSSSSSSDSEHEILDIVLERRLSVVEEVSSGGEDPNAVVSADPTLVRAKPILAMMHSLTSSSSSDGHDTVVIAESTMPGTLFRAVVRFHSTGCVSRSSTMFCGVEVMNECMQ